MRLLLLKGRSWIVKFFEEQYLKELSGEPIKALILREDAWVEEQELKISLSFNSNRVGGIGSKDLSSGSENRGGSSVLFCHSLLNNKETLSPSGYHQKLLKDKQRTRNQDFTK